MIKEVSSYSEFEEAIEGTVLVKLGATWCTPCKLLDRTLESLADEIDFDILKVDVDKFPEIAQEIMTMSIPTTVLFVNGKREVTINGAKSKETILNIIEEETK